MQKFGLIGYPVSHSFSPKIHELIYQLNNISASYSLFEIAPDKFNQNPLKDIPEDYCGFNVTIPYKTDIIPFLCEIDEEAKQIGAVNTIKKVGKKWVGFNTDVEGFCYPIMDLYNKTGTSLVIGTGGAARAVIYAILKYVKPKKLVILGRNVEKAEQLKKKYNNITESIQIEINNISNIKNYLNRADFLVNTTLVGMHPNIKDLILPESFILKEQVVVYDLIYNPLESSFLKKAKEICPSCIIINGIQMLIAQAVKSIEIWTGEQISVKNAITTLDLSKLIL